MNKTAKRVAAMIEDPELFLKYAVYTMDEADKKHFGAKQFPYLEKAYLQDMVKIWKRAEELDKHIVVEKSRQMMASWVFAALHLHEAFTVPNRKILLLSRTEGHAIELLDRLEYIYKNIPESVWPIALRPKMSRTKTKMEFEGIDSYIKSLTSSIESSRSMTASRIFIDEFARMEDADGIFQGAMGSVMGGGNVTVVSTNPTLVTATDHLFWRLIDDRLTSAPSDRRPLDEVVFKCEKGLTAHLNSNNFIAVGLHYKADPGRDPSTPSGKLWYDKTKPSMPKREWETEMEMSRSTYGGFGVFSEDYNEDYHLIKGDIEPRDGLPLLRGWDFAGNHSVSICQYVEGSLYVIDELPNIGWNTRDVVPIVLEYCAQNYPDFKFLELPDPSAFDRGRNDVDGESNIDRMVDLGIDRRNIIKVKTNRQDPRIDAVLKLLLGFVKGKPKFQIADRCQMTRTGLNGAYQFKEKLSANQSKPQISKNEYSHIIDALQYVALFIGSGHTDRYLRGVTYSTLNKRKSNGPTYRL